MRPVTVMKNVKYNLEYQEHQFTFLTGTDRLEALDMLDPIIGAMQSLYDHILKNYGYSDKLPAEMKVVGGLYSNTVNGEKLS